MEKIIDPIDVSVIKQELTPDRFLRRTNKANNELYVFSAHEAPNTMREVGRLREIAFRSAGGGTGFACDIDHCDTMENPYLQLIVWNPEAEEIVGGYRFFLGRDVKSDTNGQPILSTAHLFRFSDQFISNYMPNVLELGRSFVNVNYQTATAGAKGLFALDNLWDGLGALTVVHPCIKYYFGKVTMYPDFGERGRNLILAFLTRYFGDKEALVVPHNSLLVDIDTETAAELFQSENFKDEYKVLNTAIRDLGLNVPPLVNAYMNLSPTMRVFGTAINDEFGDVEETGILITISEIYPEKQARYIGSFVKEESGYMQKVNSAC